jgi:hypothetical protein
MIYKVLETALECRYVDRAYGSDRAILLNAVLLWIG